MDCLTTSITPNQQRILDALDRYPILSPSLLYLLVQNGGGMDVPAEARILRRRGILGSLPPQEGGQRYAYRYYAMAWHEVLYPFLDHEKLTVPYFRGRQQEQIVHALLRYPIMTPSLLGKAIYTTLVTIEHTLICMCDEDIIRVYHPGDGRQAVRYYLSIYESVLSPFLPKLG